MHQCNNDIFQQLCEKYEIKCLASDGRNIKTLEIIFFNHWLAKIEIVCIQLNRLGLCKLCTLDDVL